MPIRTKESYIKECNEIHNFKYDYSKVINWRANNKIDIICPLHGPFQQLLGNHVRGWGCKRCASKLRTKSIKQFIEESRKMHGDKYDYSKVVYTNTHAQVIIICPIHGEFTQGAKEHCLVGSRCPKCTHNPKIDTKDFIERASKIHKNKYDYSLVNYIGTDDKVDIICPKHGIFKQRPHQHLRGESCIKCSNHISNVEKEWLNSLNIPNIKIQHRLQIGDKRIYVDGFDEQTNTVYELYGDFFHGNPKYFDSIFLNKKNHKSFAVLYQKTLDREKLIRGAGYNLITIWESDYLISKGISIRKKILTSGQKMQNRVNMKKIFDYQDSGGDWDEGPLSDWSFILTIP